MWIIDIMKKHGVSQWNTLLKLLIALYIFRMIGENWFDNGDEYESPII